jgi:hypothetical protein
MHQDFTLVHQHWFLLCLALAMFPRLTLAFMLVLTDFVSGGVLWWLGYVVCPRLLIAILSLVYFTDNPVLVVFAWLVAFSGESAEKSTATKGRKKS